jgi:carbon storage regulator
MLVLSRKSQEAVVIGAAGELNEMLRVVVIEIRGGTVKLGFVADAKVAVHRQEVWERIRSEQRTLKRKPIAELPSKMGVTYRLNARVGMQTPEMVI